MGFYNVINPASMVAGQPEDVSQILANLQAISGVLNGGLDNSNISSAAAIARAKLDFGLGLGNADIAAAAAIAYSKLNLAGSIVNADIAAGAAIAFTKLGSWTWAYFGGVGNYGAGGDKNQRTFTNASVALDVRSSNYPTWVTVPANMSFKFPEVGKYLVWHRIGIAWQSTSEIAGLIFDSVGNALMDGVRGYVTAGSDVFSLHGGFSTVGIVDISAILQSRTFTPGGYTSLGGNVSHYIGAVRLPT